MGKKFYAVGVLLVALVFSSSVFAISEQDHEKIRAAADQYLSEVSDNGYHLSADDVLKRLQSGGNGFVIVDVLDTPGGTFVEDIEEAQRQYPQTIGCVI